MLRWTTSTEINNDYFAIDRSTDGVNFTEIGTEVGVGNSQTEKSYQFPDATPLAELAYYRLRQVDLDGTINYHPIITVYLDQPSEKPDQLHLYPTFASTIIRVELGFKPKQALSYAVYSPLGQAVRTGSVNADTRLLELPVEDLPAGSYIFSLTDENHRHTARFFRQ